MNIVNRCFLDVILILAIAFGTRGDITQRLIPVIVYKSHGLQMVLEFLFPYHLFFHVVFSFHLLEIVFSFHFGFLSRLNVKIDVISYGS